MSLKGIQSVLPFSQSTRNLYPFIVLCLSEIPVLKSTRLTSIIHSISSTIWVYRIHISLLILLVSKSAKFDIIPLPDVHIIAICSLLLREISQS